MSDDAVLQALAALNERLDRLEAKIDATPLTGRRSDTMAWALDGLANLEQRAPVVLDAAATIATAMVDAATERGVDPVEAGVWALELAARAARPDARALADRALDDDTVALAAKALSPDALATLTKALEPDTLALLDKVLDNADLLETALVAGTALNDALVGRDVGAIAAKLARLAAILDTPEFDALLDSGAFEGPTLSVAGKASTALVEARDEIVSVGPIGAFFKLGDPDVKRAIGFALALAKRFGARLA